MSIATVRRRKNSGRSRRKGKASPGVRLRRIREKRKLTLMEVERFTGKLARETKQPACLISAGRLSQIETTRSVPSIHKLGALSLVYQLPCVDLLKIYGVKAKK